MKNPDEALKQAEFTLEKYKKNKTLVSPEDLAGKYRVSFQNLKNELADDLKTFIRVYCFIGIRIKDKDDPVVQRIQKSFDDNQIGKRVSHAAFVNFDMEEVKRIVSEQYKENLRIYKEENDVKRKADHTG